MALTKTDKIRLFQQMTGWSVDKMRANKKQIDALLNDESVLFIEQELTEEQKAQARKNIDAGSNVDLSNALGKLAVLEDIMGITLDPELDEKYYEYFTIEATENNTTVYFKQSSYAVADEMDALKVEVSTDNGATWTEVTAAPAEDDVPGATLAELNSGDKVFIRGNNKSYGYHSAQSGDRENCNFWADKQCYVYGNIMSLVYGDDFARSIKVENLAFKSFFSDSSNETSYTWVLSKNGKELLLPATILGNKCYHCMFSGCTNLTTVPELPATTLAEGCYQGMFRYCNSLTTTCEFNATILANYCYSNMFQYCENLITVKNLPAITLKDYCYYNMFSVCPNLKTVSKISAKTLAQYCCCQMFGNCGSLVNAPELLATTLAPYCDMAIDLTTTIQYTT